jgi:hypothetical protein
MELITIYAVAGEGGGPLASDMGPPDLSEQVTKGRNHVTQMGYHERSKSRTSWLTDIETFLYSELLTSSVGE